MFGTLKRLSFAVMLLSGIATIFITLGTLNNRVPGGLTLENKVWVGACAIFVISAVLSLVLKIFGPAFDDNSALH